MFSNKNLALVLGFMMLLLTACPPKKTIKDRSRIGRQARAAGASAAAAGSACQGFQPTSNSTQWAAITNNFGDQAFFTELYYLTLPTLGQASDADQLGYVSSSANANTNTGVRFWGNVAMAGNGILQSNGSIDPNSELNIEVYDDKYSSQLCNQIRIFISPRNSSCFQGVSGTIQNNYASISFNDCMGSVLFHGTLSGNTFSGTVSYATADTGGARVLGNFQVATCGFFKCN